MKIIEEREEKKKEFEQEFKIKKKNLIWGLKNNEKMKIGVQKEEFQVKCYFCL